VKTYCLDCDGEGGTLFDDGGCSLCRRPEQVAGSHLSLGKKLEALYETRTMPDRLTKDVEAIEDLHDRYITWRRATNCFSQKQHGLIFVLYAKYYS